MRSELKRGMGAYKRRSEGGNGSMNPLLIVHAPLCDLHLQERHDEDDRE